MTARLHITDHAILRYIERAYGIDVQAIEREIAELPGLAQAAALGARSYAACGLTFRLSGLAVTTVQPSGTPSTAYREASRNKHGRSQRLRPIQTGKPGEGRSRRGGRRDRDYDEGAE